MSCFKSTSMWVDVSRILSIRELFTPSEFPVPSVPGVLSVTVLWGQACSQQEEVFGVRNLLSLPVTCPAAQPLYSPVPLFAAVGLQTSPPPHACISSPGTAPAYQ